MTLAYQDDWLTIHGGDCRDVLTQLDAGGVHCVVTSPPYWGLRDYGTADWQGGDPDCAHEQLPDQGSTSQREGRKYLQGHVQRDCRCGAQRVDAQLGLEPTPELYVENLVSVMREVRRVLRDDGTLWLNLGDSFGGRTAVGRNDTERMYGANGGARSSLAAQTFQSSGRSKDLVGIPWRVAFALQADGWYLRSDIVWAKPNVMPESVTDRPTRAHEFIFMLTKQREYYFDQDAVRESGDTGAWDAMPPIGGVKHVEGNGNPTYSGARVASDGRRNIRSVWTIATKPYPGAHFAVFPPEIPERCIKASTSERGVCSICGAPWERHIERTGYHFPERDATDELHLAGGRIANYKSGPDFARFKAEHPDVDLGWRPTCQHAEAPTVPAVVLDPFGGSGTTAMVAQSLSRRAVLIDLNPKYFEQQLARNSTLPLGL